MSSPLFVLAVLAASVVVSEILVRRTWLRHLGTALVVIVVTAIVANLGVIPTGSSPLPIYGVVFKEVAWLAIFWLLLEVNLAQVLRAGRTMIVLFLVGALGTSIGAIVGMWLISGRERIGPSFDVLAGMFTGTYTGGSTNFIAIASHYQMTDGTILVAANAVDAAMTTVWMGVTLAVPRLLVRFVRRQGTPVHQLLDGEAPMPGAPKPSGKPLLGVEDDTETVHPIDLGLLVALGAFAVWASDLLGQRSAQALGFSVPGILILTTVALALAQIPAISSLRGKRLLGMFGVYLFLAVIGALCDFRALVESGGLGLAVLAFVVVLLLVHGVVTFGAGILFRVDPDIAAVASQANIGGGTSALALARSLGRADLVLPAILVGSLGNALGTYLGIAVTNLVQRLG
jgi:uncharacterized membrane protein